MALDGGSVTVPNESAQSEDSLRHQGSVLASCHCHDGHCWKSTRLSRTNRNEFVLIISQKS